MTDVGDIEAWWEELITRVRSHEEPFTELIEVHEPCQIEVFWLRDGVEGQVFVNTHSPERGDKEILVHGPFDGAEFVDKVGEIAEESRWQEKDPSPGIIRPGQQVPTKADALSGLIGRFTDKLQQSIFNESSSSRHTFLAGHRLWDSTYGQYVMGNVTDMEIDDFFRTSSSTTSTTESETEEVQSVEDNDEAEENTQEEGGGGYIYPPVWVDQAPEKTFEEKVRGTPQMHHDLMLREEFLDKEIIVVRDGLIILLSEDAEEIREILNTIFGIGIFLGRPWRSLQGREIVSVSVGQEMVHRTRAELSTRRAQLHQSSSDLPNYIKRGVVSSDQLRDLIQLAEKVYEEDGLKEKIILHLQAQTHLLDQEYTASFLLNWNIIEQQILDILNPHLRDNYNVNSDRRRNMERGSHWSTSHMLEVAEITDAITDDQYTQLDEFRSKRNNIVHKMETASEEQAGQLNDLVSDFLLREIDETLSEASS